MAPSDDSDPAEPVSGYERRFDEAPAEAVVTTVTEVTGQSPLEMEPLWEVIDPDALNVLVGSRADRTSSVTVTFEYCGHQVTVTADGIQLSRLDSTER